MGSHIIIEGRRRMGTRVSRRLPQAMGSPPPESGLENYAQPIPPDPRDLPVQSKGRMHSADDDLNYRIVAEGVLTAAGGWGTLAFWVEHFKTGPELVRELARRGCFDAAISETLGRKRFRLLDPARARVELERVRAQRVARKHRVAR